jgi:hypothetical protein
METGYRKITDIDNEEVLRRLTRRFNARGVAWRLERHSRGFTRVFVRNTHVQVARSLCDGVKGVVLKNDGERVSAWRDDVTQQDLMDRSQRTA